LFAAALLVVFGVISWSIAGGALGIIACVMALVIGYVFVLLSWVLYYLLQKVHLVTAEFTWPAEHR
jgi:hypothetical protein